MDPTEMKISLILNIVKLKILKFSEKIFLFLWLLFQINKNLRKSVHKIVIVLVLQIVQKKNKN